MPKTILTPEQISVARVLEGTGWSHARIGDVFRVCGSTISYALKHRKTQLPDETRDPRPAIVAQILRRVDRVTRRAAAKELRDIASELESQSGN